MVLKEIKEYLRVDGDEEDNLISSLYATAKLYIKNATGITKEMAKDNESIKETYNLTSKILISHWYENRLPQTTGTNFHNLDFSLISLFLHLEAEYLKMKRSGTI